MSRPFMEIDFDLVDKLCELHCTEAEVAAACGIHRDTLVGAIRKKFDKTFPEYFSEKSAAGKISLRRSQWKVACETENPALLIWLGKQHLGQSDKREEKTESTVTNIVRFTRAGD